MLWSCKSDVYLQSPSLLREQIWTRNHREDGCQELSHWFSQGASLHFDGCSRRFPKGAETFCQRLLDLQGLVWVVNECSWNNSGAFLPWKMHPPFARLQQGHRSAHALGEAYSNATRLLSQAARIAECQNKIQVPAVVPQVCWIPRKTCCHPFKQA